MLDGKVTEMDQMHLENIQVIFERRKASYDKLLIQTAIVKEADKWKNVFTKLIPLAKEYQVEKTLNYEGFLVASIIAEPNEFCSVLEQLVTHGKLRIRGCPEVQFEGSCYDKKGNYVPSYDEEFGLGWSANFWNFYSATDSRGRPPRNILLAVNKPSFPDGSAAIRSVIGYDTCPS